MRNVDNALKEHDYGINIAVQGLITAMGMFSENLQKIKDNKNMEYRLEDFSRLIDRLGIHHNSVLTRWREYNEKKKEKTKG